MNRHLSEIQQIIRQNLPSLRERYPIESIALFGSVVRDDFDPERSDVDVLVAFNGNIGWEIFDLESELEKLIGYKIDLVTEGGLTAPWWRDHILSQAQYVRENIEV